MASIDELRAAIQRACQPTTAAYIVEGRGRVLAMPRAWVCENIEKVALESLNMEDYWEYRRLLELLDFLQSNDVLKRMISIGHESKDADIRETADDFSE